MDLKETIGIEGKEGTMEDYAGTLWESVFLSNNVSKNGVTMDIQAKKSLENIMTRAIEDKSNIKA